MANKTRVELSVITFFFNDKDNDNIKYRVSYVETDKPNRWDVFVRRNEEIILRDDSCRFANKTNAKYILLELLNRHE